MVQILYRLQLQTLGKWMVSHLLVQVIFIYNSRIKFKQHKVYFNIDLCIFKGARQIKGSPAYYMATFHPMKPSALNMTHTSLVIEEATRSMADAYVFILISRPENLHVIFINDKNIKLMR